MTQHTILNLLHPRLKVGIVGLAPTAILADDQLPDAPFKIDLNLMEIDSGACLVQATLVNTGASPLRVKGFRWQHDPAVKGGPALHFPGALRPQVFATENLRGDYFGTGTVEGDRYAYPLTNQHVEYGHAEDSVFPGVFIAAAEAPVGIFIAQASQNRLFAFFRFKGKMEHQEKWLFEIEERVTGISSIEIPPGATLCGEQLFFQIVDTSDPQQATATYFRHLSTSGAFARRADNPLPAQRIYCTWNYDFMADIDTEKALGQIPVLKKHFPMVKFLQIDDGYQRCHAPGQRAMIDLCYGDLETPWDPARFPEGPKAVADAIKAEGLRPAIWLGLWASSGSKMIQDHPDWVLRDDTGAPWTFDAWYGGTVILDPSVPGVRDYLHRMCATVFGEWGFEGVKLDFSSFAFNAKRVRFRHPGKSAVELRHELETIFRRHLPQDGFFGWCVVAGTAQPFLAQADYFRNAVDIGRGDWETAKRIAMWTANTRLFLQEAPCLPNIDSIGWSAAFDETCWLSWLNFCAISGGALEVSGDLRKLPEARLERLSRTLALSDPSRRVRCPGLGSARGTPPPVWIATGVAETLVGVFNWTDSPARVDLADAADLIPTRSATDPWIGETAPVPGVVELAAHESRLWLFES